MHILIIHDRLSKSASKDELDTRLQAQQVEAALLTLGHQVSRMEFSLDLLRMRSRIAKLNPGHVFNLVETLEGSKLLHVAPALFETMGLPFSGGGSQGMMLTSDKPLAKRFMRLARIPTPAWMVMETTGELTDLIGTPVIVKPVTEEASVGINDDSVRIFQTAAQLRSAVKGTYGRPLFAEQYIEGREFNISILPIDGVPTVLPIAEMLFLDYPVGKPTIAGYEAKWDEDSFAYTHTQRSFSFPPHDSALLQRLHDISLRCWQLFGAKGYARVDFRVDASGEPYVLEVNLNPCVAYDSGFTAAAAQQGLSYVQMIEQILKG
ncbi:MAG: D-alanine--D-alanine ligase [Spirochaetae bacterium HGW-Spirochaetae-8]|jgi:D-alanine-D-alanine ligase|nr:MAG: D-alanine--D-alanine ligase [Spirochaetae bacterium HGW-Spirochaetae-8]